MYLPPKCHNTDIVLGETLEESPEARDSGFLNSLLGANYNVSPTVVRNVEGYFVEMVNKKEFVKAVALAKLTEEEKEALGLK